MIQIIKIIIYIVISLASIKSQHTYPNHPIANLSTTWINNADSNNFAFTDQQLRAILVRPIPTLNLAYACGFFTNRVSIPNTNLTFSPIPTNFQSHFSVSILNSKDTLTSDYEHQLVWSANTNNPFDTNATFQLSPDGNMILKDAGGEVIWSTNTAGMSVKGLNLTESGNLVLFDVNNDVVWQSFDHPKDSTKELFSYPIICAENGQCSCPLSADSPSISYFTQVDKRVPNLGCTLITPLDCNESHLHSFIEVLKPNYFSFTLHINHIDKDTCMKACLNDCSCKAVVFVFSNGYCYFPSQIYFNMGPKDELLYNSSNMYLKVQTAPMRVVSRKNHVPMIIGLAFVVLFALGGIVSAFIVIMIWAKMQDKVNDEDDDDDDEDDDDLDSLPISLEQFSSEDLEIATWNFSIKLGEGGFGKVFKGSLKDGTKVAVKYIDGMGHIEKTFLTEVRSIGNIHHVNLVKLVGYCADKSHRLLVYEYMANGSLDKWLDNGRQKFPLDWNQRKNIVIGIAKGLAYLHEDCRQKIIHLDVKPGNILLDENFNAKLSDFGLSKLLSKDQSKKIVTTLRGTPGYMAPEWLSSVITEKVDVYSFGVVIMEIVCGRKVFDTSQHEDKIHLLSLFSQKAKERKLLDMVDEYCNDTHSHGTEVIKMMQVAAWCLQNEFSVRPSMSLVVKVLEGIVNVDLTHLDYNFH